MYNIPSVILSMHLVVTTDTLNTVTVMETADAWIRVLSAYTHTKALTHFIVKMNISRKAGDVHHCT